MRRQPDSKSDCAVPQLGPVREAQLFASVGARPLVFHAGDIIEHDIRIGHPPERERLAADVDRLRDSRVVAMDPAKQSLAQATT